MLDPGPRLVPGAGGPLVAQAFRQGDITAVRHAVAGQSAHSGLSGRRLEDFVLAVNELVTNAVRHAGGDGRLRLWAADGVLHCEVGDDGPGIPADRVAPAAPPPVSAAGGRGLWLVRSLCDTVTVATGPTGTTVHITAALLTGSGAAKAAPKPH